MEQLERIKKQEDLLKKAKERKQNKEKLARGTDKPLYKVIPKDGKVVKLTIDSIILKDDDILVEIDQETAIESIDYIQNYLNNSVKGIQQVPHDEHNSYVYNVTLMFNDIEIRKKIKSAIIEQTNKRPFTKLIIIPLMIERDRNALHKLGGFFGFNGGIALALGLVKNPEQPNEFKWPKIKILGMTGVYLNKDSATDILFANSEGWKSLLSLKNYFSPKNIKSFFKGLIKGEKKNGDKKTAEKDGESAGQKVKNIQDSQKQIKKRWGVGLIQSSIHNVKKDGYTVYANLALEDFLGAYSTIAVDINPNDWAKIEKIDNQALQAHVGTKIIDYGGNLVNPDAWKQKKLGNLIPDFKLFLFLTGPSHLEQEWGYMLQPILSIFSLKMILELKDKPEKWFNSIKSYLKTKI